VPIRLIRLVDRCDISCHPIWQGISDHDVCLLKASLERSIEERPWATCLGDASIAWRRLRFRIAFLHAGGSVLLPAWLALRREWAHHDVAEPVPVDSATRITGLNDQLGMLGILHRSAPCQPMSLDRGIKRCEFAQDAHNLSRAGSFDVQAKGVHRIKTSNDVRLLLRRMAMLDVAPGEVNSADPLLFRELQGRCSLCPSRVPCARDLAHDAADAQSCDWREYCPNAAMLGFLGRTAHANGLLYAQVR
jgi:hypothetical protein